MTVDSENDFTSIGALASALSVTTRRIEKVAGELGITGSLRLNGVIHFDGAQVERLTTAIYSGQQTNTRQAAEDAGRRSTTHPDAGVLITPDLGTREGRK